MRQFSKNHVAALALAGVVLLVACGTGLAQKPAKPKEAPEGEETFEQVEKLLVKLLTPADPSRAAKQVRKLAERVMPTTEQLKANGDWKLPWEFPAGISVNLGEDLESPDRVEFYRVPQDRYWAARGKDAVCVGLTREEATKRVGELLTFYDKHKAAAAQEGFDENYFRSASINFLIDHHPVSPTLAVSQEAGIEYHAHRQAKQKGNPNKGITEEEQVQLDLEKFDTLFPGIKGAAFKERLVEAYTLNQRWTRFVFCRTNKWDQLTRLGDALKAKEDLLREALPDLKDGPLTDVDPPENLLKDPRWEKAEKRVNELLGEGGTVDRFIKKNQIRFSTCVVNVREVSPDTLEQMKDPTEKDAARLQDKFKSAFKAQIELDKPFHEEEFEKLRAEIADAENAGNKDQADQLRKELTRRKQKWDEYQKAETTKVQKRDGYGQSCFVLSNPIIHLLTDTPNGTMHTVAIRNGNVFVEFQIYSTMSKEEAAKDLEFFLKAMHAGTLYGQGPTR